MTTTATLKFVVEGDSYQELKERADAAISKFLEISEEFDFEDDEEEYEESPPAHKIDYELVVSESLDISSDHQYTAEVIARIKDVRR